MQHFAHMGIAHYFLSKTGAPFDVIKGLLAENFVYLSLKRRIDNTNEIAGYVPWFGTYEKINGELDFYVRNVKNCKNYGVEVKSTDEAARTGRKLLEDKKLDYLAYLTQAGLLITFTTDNINEYYYISFVGLKILVEIKVVYLANFLCRFTNYVITFLFKSVR